MVVERARLLVTGFSESGANDAWVSFGLDVRVLWGIFFLGSI